MIRVKRLLGGVAAVGLVLTAVVILARPSSSSTPGPEPAEPEPLLGPRAELVAPSAGPRPEGPALPTARAKVRANGGTRPARLAAVPVSVTAQRTVWIDTVGNVSEWLDACKDDDCHFYGGAFLNNDPVPDFASCKRPCAGDEKTFRSATIGFRCRHDAEPERK